MSPHKAGWAAKERDLVDNHLAELHLLFFNVIECSSYKSDINHTRNTSSMWEVKLESDEDNI